MGHRIPDEVLMTKYVSIIAKMVITILLFVPYMACSNMLGDDSSDKPIVPAAPTITSIEARDRRLIVLWEPVSHANTYEVWYGTGADIADAVLFSDADNTDTVRTITGLTNSTAYNVWVRAFNHSTEGPYSEADQGTPYPIVGDRRTYTVSGVSFDMVFVPGLTFPTGLDDSNTATVDQGYWMADTEATNELVAAVLQWAYDQGKFQSPNYIDSTTINYRGQELMFLGGTQNSISWSEPFFTLDSGRENYPSNLTSWFGAVMISNWITEIIFNNTDQIVYTWTDNGDGGGTASDGIWQDGETDANNTMRGFRLPEITEWELAARYLGSEAPIVEPLATERLTTNNNGTTFYWTPGRYASGATDDYTNHEATNLVSWNFNNSYSLGSSHADYENHIVGTSNISMVGRTTPPDPKSSSHPNILGIFDMSGNLIEVCFTRLNNQCYILGGNWGPMGLAPIRIGTTNLRDSGVCAYGAGFRIVLTE